MLGCPFFQLRLREKVKWLAPVVRVGAELGLGSQISFSAHALCPRSGVSGQDSSRGLGIKEQASDLEALAQTLGWGTGKGWVLRTGCRVQPTTGKELGITTHSLCSSKKWAENTFVEDLLHARYCVYNTGAY